MKTYKRRFYKDRHQASSYPAQAILSEVLERLPAINSAVDVGCGVGTWLAVLKEKGVSDIQGIDGPWVAEDLLEIPEQNFLQANLRGPIDLNRRFDLTISLEVAEHLPAEAAQTFVNSLVSLADFVLFSAAIPFQGGTNHINEQWPEYWAQMFRSNGYVALDIIRRRIWNDDRIGAFYRQNIMLYAKRERMQDLRMPILEEYSELLPMALVHPDTYLRKVGSVKGSWGTLRRALKRWCKSLLRNSPAG